MIPTAASGLIGTSSSGSALGLQRLRLPEQVPPTWLSEIRRLK
jgi:hypothetical protein